ncbi:3D domain-containing protein [Anaerospora sp.]|uniref:3D domain-containing protein n=1 Tax=Anaerospora sp. TaxID=1960278 RepID=UPI0028980871|nr:3D domain-containing protein [Anaerospora sp.]
MLKKTVILMLLISYVSISQPTPAHAGFFLVNIINGIFKGSPKNTPAQPKPPNNQTVTLVKLGMQNSQVTTVQRYLIKAEYLTGKADGIFGYQTLQAVKLFQQEAGLLADGIVGVKTLSALKNFKGTRQQNNPVPRKPAYTPPKSSNDIPAHLYAIPMMVTGYTRYDPDCTDYTYRGTYLRRGLCAVDPDVIPLGTRLYVPGYGEALADDIGGAINGNHIDLAMDTRAEAFDWGRRHVTVYILPEK